MPPVNSFFGFPLTSARVLLLVVSIALLSACKIEVIVPTGGKVVSEDGVICLTGATCTIEVKDENYDDTFRAVPDPGYVFKGWKSGEDHFCAKDKGPCRLLTTVFDGNEQILDIIASNKTYYLKPVFVNKSGYKVSYWKTLLAQIDKGSFSTKSFLYDIEPIIAQCDPGVLSSAVNKRTLRVTNKVRALHKLPAVQHDSFYNAQTQATALVQKANNYLSHFPDPADLCFTESAASGASTSNIGNGAQADPASDILGWINDNFNIAQLDQAGHRRWMLAPALGYVSYGQVEGSTALKVFGFTQTPKKTISPKVEFVAFPYKSYPWVLVSKGQKPTPWSLSIVPPSGTSSRFDYFSNAKITVQEKGKSGSLPVHSTHFDTEGFGLANFLSWQVDDWDYDIIYAVSISNIMMPGGDKRTISYSVLLDRYNLVNIRMPLEAGDINQGNTLRGNFNSAEDEDSYVVSVSGNVSLRGENSRFSNQAFFIRVYDDRKKLLVSRDESFTVNLSAGQYTVIVSPCDETGLCYQNVPDYSVSIQP